MGNESTIFNVIKQNSRLVTTIFCRFAGSVQRVFATDGVRHVSSGRRRSLSSATGNERHPVTTDYRRRRTLRAQNVRGYNIITYSYC